MARRFHRVRHHGGRALAGGKGSLVALGTGAGTSLASSYVIGAVPFLGGAWWAMPAALAVVGHFLKRKNPAIGGALLGIAGYWGMSQYSATRPIATTKGYDDAGAFGGVSYNDNIGTDAAPALNTAQAAALVVPKQRAGAMGFIDAGAFDPAEAGEVLDAMGLDT